VLLEQMGYYRILVPEYALEELTGKVSFKASKLGWSRMIWYLPTLPQWLQKSLLMQGKAGNEPVSFKKTMFSRNQPPPDKRSAQLVRHELIEAVKH